MLKFLALQGAPYIYDISRLRVNVREGCCWIGDENIKGQRLYRFSIRTISIHSFVLCDYGSKFSMSVTFPPGIDMISSAQD
jgi:hypothetical protein